jgi:hypothetical protein
MAIDVKTTTAITSFVGPQFDDDGNLTLILLDDNTSAQDAMYQGEGIRVTLGANLADSLAASIVDGMRRRLLP